MKRSTSSAVHSSRILAGLTDARKLSSDNSIICSADKEKVSKVSIANPREVFYNILKQTSGSSKVISTTPCGLPLKDSTETFLLIFDT